LHSDVVGPGDRAGVVARTRRAALPADVSRFERACVSGGRHRERGYRLDPV